MEQDSSQRTLRLSGALTIDRAASLKAELAVALSESQEVLADLSAIVDLDLACLQIFYAARKQAVSGGKAFHFVGSVPSRVVRRLSASGFLRGDSERAEDFEASLADF